MEALLLGVAQDGGVPQAGCQCPRCTVAHRDPARRQLVVCLGLIDHDTQSTWMIDATPDFREQLHLLSTSAPGYALKGIWLTHAHMGHYTGLLHLGKEAMGANRMPVYATASVCAFLRGNEPWATLSRDGFIALTEIEPEQPYPLADITVTAHCVPHRSEYSDTVAYSLQGPHSNLFYCPDIDRWQTWQRNICDVVSAHHISLLDGSFFTHGELNRDMSLIPHPLVTDTVERLQGLRDKAAFIHLNHTNPLLSEDSPQRHWLHEQGFAVGSMGARWTL